ncbi:MAG TPA: hypothetical protein VGM07_10585 [Stellaceae bacterium]|jgi:hypothetical protein
MSNEISWPTKPFYLQSKIGLSNWALTITAQNTVVMQALDSAIDQLWAAIPDQRGGAFLKHVGLGRVLARGSDGHLQAVNQNGADPAQLWRVEDLGRPWVGINSLTDWEQKINVYGSNVHGTIGTWRWDGGADNEEWRLVEESGAVTIDGIVYDTSKAVADLGKPPSRCAATTVDNTRSGVPDTSTYTLSRSVTTTRSFTNSESDTTGHKYTQTFGVKGGIDKVIEVSASASFEESDSKTISITSQTSESETNTDTVSTSVNVPAGKKYRYQVVVHYGKVSVPYTARLTFQSVVPGAAPVHFEQKGMFEGVNATGVAVEVVDITPSEAKSETVVALEKV